MSSHSTRLKELRDITVSILDPQQPAYSLRNEVMELRSLFEQAGGTLSATDDIASGETLTDRGVAISPRMASMCLDDFARTVQFIRGVHDAVLDLRRDVTDRPVRVLYAGCGPWAPLAIPLMSIFDPNTARFSLIDIHAESIDSVRRIAATLGLSDSVEISNVDDAATYQLTDTVPDLIVVEMLRAALRSEPQVAVAGNLIGQAPGAVMIPEEVRVDLTLVGRAREHSLDGSPVERQRLVVGTVFKLNSESLKQPPEPVVLKLPDFATSHYEPMLLTTVQVYGEHSLRDYDSGITVPVRISEKIAPGDTVEFRYEMGTAPRLINRVLDTASNIEL